MQNFLGKNSLFANLKKCRFHKDKVRFLGYVISSHNFQIEDERIEVVKNWPKPKSVQDIPVFIGFTNFYRRFIRGFSRRAAPLISILKTTRSSDLALRDNVNKVVLDGGDRNLFKFKKSKNTKFGIQKHIGATGKPTFLTSGARKAFNQLRQVIIKAPILQHFDPECHIRIDIDALGYVIRRVLSQLTSDHLISDHLISDQGQWHLLAYFLRKIIPAKTRYKTHDGELLAIVEVFKTWRYYLKGCKHEVLVLTNHNNLCQFMDTTSLSSR